MIRVVASRRPDLEGASAMGRVLVAFRMGVRFREVLATLAYCSDLSMGLAVERILELPAARVGERAASLVKESGDRGRPSDIPEDESFNQLVEVQETGESYSTHFVGHWVDQCIYLSTSAIDRLEAIAKSAGLSADEALDAVIAGHLAGSLAR